VRRGYPSESEPGRSIVIPSSPEQLAIADQDLDRIRSSFLSRLVGEAGASSLSDPELEFLAAEVNRPPDTVAALLASGRAGALSGG
jgi:hypothetical protein